MSLFVDTSAFLAVLDADDRHHQSARDFWQDILQGDETLMTTNYVLLETYALVQNRLGMDAVREFSTIIMPLLNVLWVDEDIHQRGLSALLAANRRKLSLVDCISFEAARSLAIQRVFTFDKHFAEQGFQCEPEG
jgi:predicted nucleic acid-binding protein